MSAASMKPLSSLSAAPSSGVLLTHEIAGLEDGTVLPTAAAQPVPWPSRLGQALLLIALEATSVALALFFFRLPDRMPAIRENQLSHSEVAFGLKSVATSVGFAWLAALAFLSSRRSLEAVEQLQRFSRLGAPLIAVAFLPAMFDWRVFSGHDLLAALSMTLFGLLVERLTRVALGALPAAPLASLELAIEVKYPRLWRRLPLGIVLFAVAATGAYFSFYTLRDHWNIRTASYDLGIFDNIMWNSLRGHFLRATPDLGRTGYHIIFHATLLVPLFLPIYALYQHAETLLVIQATLVPAAAIPLYLLAERRLQHRGFAVLIALAYLLYAPMHGPVFYDFHYLTLAPFFVLWMLYFFETERPIAFPISFAFCLLLREDIGIGVAAVMLFYLISGVRPKVATLCGALAIAYSSWMKLLVMPSFGTGEIHEAFTWMYKDLLPPGQMGFSSVLRTVFANPVYTLQTLLTVDKARYLLELFGPVLLIPLRYSRAWVLFLPGFIITLLTTGYEPTTQTSFQYSTHWTMYVFAGLLFALSVKQHLELERRRLPAAILGLSMSSLAFSYQNGALLQQNTFKGGFGPIRFDRPAEFIQKEKDLLSLLALIPPTASVTASETLVPHISNRYEAFTLRSGFQDADYVIADSTYRVGTESEVLRTGTLSGAYGFVRAAGPYVLWKRGAPHDHDAEGLRILGFPVPASWALPSPSASNMAPDRQSVPRQPPPLLPAASGSASPLGSSPQRAPFPSRPRLPFLPR